MRKRRTRSLFDEPSLVPLADMLTNTVGIMVFILIFTVLTAGGAVIAKRLPMEHKTEKSDVTFICWNNRLYHFPDELVEEFLNPLGKPTVTLDGFREYVEKFKARKLENECLTLTGEGEIETASTFTGTRTSMVLTLVCTPKDGAGETVVDLQGNASAFRGVLAKTNREKKFIMFLVRGDSIDVFGAARDAAAAKQFSTGWSPQIGDQPIRFSLTGGGRKAAPL
ncbi:MAG: hypothetical protein JW959_09590 [Pirellulales bacterium]|nr:hypothetical protein [Pirellulales bacterium]